jgi:hypothetical protein
VFCSWGQGQVVWHDGFTSHGKHYAADFDRSDHQTSRVSQQLTRLHHSKVRRKATPQPIASVQPQDQFSDCTMIRAEIEANNAKATQLANEQGGKVAQNVAAGVVGLVIWPVWFGMDFKDAAGKEAAALQARQQFLTTLATERCAPGYRPPPAPAVYVAPPQHG